MKKNESYITISPGFFVFLFGGIFGFFVVLTVVFGSWYTVPAGHRAVLLTFGAPSDEAFSEGFHWKMPLVQKDVSMSVQTLKYEAEAAAASKDLQVVSGVVAVNYHLVPEMIPNIYKDLGLGYQDRVIQPAVQEVVKATTAEFTAEELITKRPIVKEQIKFGLEERLRDRGVVVEDISIVNFDFSASFNQAIESKVTAEQLKLKAERDLQRIEIEAQQIVATAKGEKEAKIANAQAEAESIRIVQEQLDKSPAYVDWYGVSKWDGVLPRVTGGAVPFVDVTPKEVRT